MENSNNNEIWVFLSHSNKDYEKVFTSESGSFYIDELGIAQRFEPATDNPFIDEETELIDKYHYETHQSISSLIVPEGVKGFVGGFMRGVRVIDRVVLTDTLESIDENCFANCILPSVVIPASIQKIGIFAFGHTHIECLQLPESLHSPYGRQFKDSYIGMLRMPKELKDDVALGRNNDLCINDQWLDNDKYGYLRWPSTYIENLEFY